MTEPIDQQPTPPAHPAAPPGYAAPAPGAPAYGYAPVSAPTNQKALLSMIFGIVGLTLVPILASIVAVVLGHMSRKEIERTGEPGRGMSTAGLVMGYIGSVGYLVLIGVVLVFFTALLAAGGVST